MRSKEFLGFTLIVNGVSSPRVILAEKAGLLGTLGIPILPWELRTCPTTQLSLRLARYTNLYKNLLTFLILHICHHCEPTQTFPGLFNTPSSLSK